MQLTVFGASGHIGQLVVERLVAQGHTVIAVTHRHNPFQAQPNLRVVTCDIHDGSDVASAISGSQVVISTLSSWHSKAKDVLSVAMSNILPAMKAEGIARIVTLTGSDARATSDPAPTRQQDLMRHMLMIIAVPILFDSEAHIRALESSGLDWTVIRTPVQRSMGPQGRWRLTESTPRPWASVHRNDVAAAIVKVATSHEYVKSAPHLN